MRSSRQELRTEPSSVALSPSSPEKVRWQMQPLQLAIARRAYELFEARGGEHGHDWEDWFQAESELLRPVPVVTSESRDMFTLCANVLGFAPEDLQVGIEPFRLTILGNLGDQLADAYPSEILRIVELPVAIVPERSRVSLRTGVLRFDLPKLAKEGTQTPAA